MIWLFCQVPTLTYLLIVLFSLDSRVLFNVDLIIKCDVHERMLNTLLLPFYQSYVSVYLYVCVYIFVSSNWVSKQLGASVSQLDRYVLHCIVITYGLCWTGPIYDGLG